LKFLFCTANWRINGGKGEILIQIQTNGKLIVLETIRGKDERVKKKIRRMIVKKKLIKGKKMKEN
jgi:hypothetical protein